MVCLISINRAIINQNRTFGPALQSEAHASSPIWVDTVAHNVKPCCVGRPRASATARSRPTLSPGRTRQAARTIGLGGQPLSARGCYESEGSGVRISCAERSMVSGRKARDEEDGRSAEG